MKFPEPLVGKLSRSDEYIQADKKIWFRTRGMVASERVKVSPEN
jgi:hypothetical protein